MSFEFHNGAVVSILISKDETKIRIVSNSLHEMYPIVRELILSLEAEHAPRDIEDIIEFSSQLPYNDFFEVLDHHFQLRTEFGSLRKLLEKRTIQLRMIQKRLLNRFKDKNPSPLNNLDYLLSHTYN